MSQYCIDHLDKSTYTVNPCSIGKSQIRRTAGARKSSIAKKPVHALPMLLLVQRTLTKTAGLTT
jgi:hypothetical protein